MTIKLLSLTLKFMFQPLSSISPLWPYHYRRKRTPRFVFFAFLRIYFFSLHLASGEWRESFCGAAVGGVLLAGGLRLRVEGQGDEGAKSR